MKHHLKAVLLTIVLASTGAAYAIEGSGGDRDTSRGSNWDPNMRAYEERGGYYYQDDNLRARHQELRDDEAERRMKRDFDVQSRMNN